MWQESSPPAPTGGGLSKSSSAGIAHRTGPQRCTRRGSPIGAPCPTARRGQPAFATQVEAHFPEIVDHIVLVNAPRVFASAFPLVRAFMDPITAAKIEVHARVPSSRLLQLMPNETLPSDYGGTAPALPQMKTWGEFG